MTKKILILSGVIGVTVAFTACGDHRSPGRAYMPDMTYSRAYETYAPTAERLANSEADGDPFYNNKPVAGTVARGEMVSYQLPNDSAGYAQSFTVPNPLDRATLNYKEAERLYLINCAICHGTKLDGNGPLYRGGEGPYTAAPKNLMGDDKATLTEGRMFHVATYGKGQMGAYSSQLTTRQRWMVVAYIRQKQMGGAGAAAADSTGAATAPGTTGQASAAGAPTASGMDSTKAPK